MAFAGDEELSTLQHIHPALRDSANFGRPLAAALPDVVLDALLYLVDTPTFASLVVLNRHWRRKCSTTLLYAYFLAQATSSESSLKETWDNYMHKDLPYLKRHLARLAKQNLYPVFRPRLSAYHVVAPVALSSTSAPHGEFFSYSFSSRASSLAIYNACRLFVVNLQGPEPVVSKGFSIQQRPIAVDITDDGLTLALLLSELKLKVFSLRAEKAEQSRTILLEEPARALALTPDGTMVAAAQERAIELLALSEIPGRVPRRAVACEEVTHLAFSQNGKLLLGTHTRLAKASTTLISAPDDMAADMGAYDEIPEEDMAMMWISRPLFPSAFEKTTHAVLLPGDQAALLAYDEPADSFGMLDTQLMAFSRSLLEVPSEFLQPSSLPCVTAGGEVAAILFSNSGFRLLGLTAVPAGDNASENFAPQRWMPFKRPVSRARWQNLPGIRQCLFAVGAGKSTHPALIRKAADEDRESGSLFAFDFDCHVEASKSKDIIIDLSSTSLDILEADGDEEDAIHVQKRPASRASDRPKNMPLARSVTAARRKQRARVPVVTEVAGAGDEEQQASPGAEVPEEQHLDELYHPSQPRPQSTLIRSASTIAARREREPPRFLANEPPRMRRPGDPSEVPDESDADNWVPPPPAYDGQGQPESPRETRGSRLPPVPPERSPNRPRLAISTSTPNLVAAGETPVQIHPPPQEGNRPNKLQRPRQKRVKSVYENARKSIVMGTQSVRRAFSGPSGDTEDKPAPRPDATQANATPAERTREPVPSGPLDHVPVLRTRRQRPVSAVVVQSETITKRRSVLQRPQSYASSGVHDSRPENRRSLSQPIPLSSSMHSIPFPRSPDSPSIPSSAQMASLHRRQTSGSISSIGSNVSGAPRAAVGAVRAATTPNSPWASSTMLATLSEGDGPSDGPANGPATGRAANGQQSTKPNANPPRRLQEARASLNSARVGNHVRQRSYTSTDSPSRPTTSPPPEDKALNWGESRDERPQTSGSRLTTIQSVASAIKDRSRSRGRNAGVQRSNSKRDKTNGVTSGNISDAKKRGKGFFSRWKKTLLSSLESV